MKCPRCKSTILGMDCDICGLKNNRINRLRYSKLFWGIAGGIMIFIVSAIGMITVAEPFPKDYITLETYNKVEIGMTYKEVVEIVGYKGEVMSQYGDYTYLRYNGRGFVKGNALLVFNKDKVDNKTETGLK